MTGDPQHALNDLLDAIVECGSSVDLERHGERDGPVVCACDALGRSLPDEMRSWLRIGTGTRDADA